MLNWRRSGNGTFASHLLIGLAVLASGCASAPNQHPRAPDEHSGYIARPCAPLKEEGSRGIPIAMALEVADVEEALGTPTKDWLAVHPVRLHSVAKFILPLTSATPGDNPSGTC